MSRSWLFRLFRNLLRGDRVEKELDEELHSYVDLLADEKTAAGLPEKMARRAARVEVGGIEQVKEEVRDQRSGAVLERLVQDARYGLSMAARNPTFAGVVLLTLAIGIGGTTAVFSLVDAVLLNPLPFPRADRIVTVWQHNVSADTERLAGAPANFLDHSGGKVVAVTTPVVGRDHVARFMGVIFGHARTAGSASCASKSTAKRARSSSISGTTWWACGRSISPRAGSSAYGPW